MGTINVQSVSKQSGGQVVLDEVSGEHAQYNGSYSDYIRQIEEQARPDKHPVERDKRARGKQRRLAVDRSGASGVRKRSRFDRLSLEMLETFIMEREEQLSGFETRFADPTVYRDGATVARLREQFETLKQKPADNCEGAGASGIGIP